MTFRILIVFVIGCGTQLMATPLQNPVAPRASFRSFHQAGHSPGPPHWQKLTLISDVPEVPKVSEMKTDQTPVQLISWQTILIGFAVYMVLVLVAAFAYVKFRSDVPLQDMRFLPKDGFSDAIYSCAGSWSICFYACCCPCLRWSDTVSKVGLMYFWFGVMLWAPLLYFNYLVAGVSWPILALLGAGYRYRLRSHFGLERGATRVCQDLVAWCCCMPCAIAQEARHVDRTIGLVM